MLSSPFRRLALCTQVMVNLNPVNQVEVRPHLTSMHDAEGCSACPTCKKCPTARNRMDVRINHYVGSKGDFFDHTRHFWTVSVIGVMMAMMREIKHDK